MSHEDFERFRQLVLEDLPLQEHLREVNGRGDFVRRVVETGASRGFEFSAEEVEQAMSEARRLWIERWI